VEHLTHKAYFVQTKRIKQSVNTKLDMLLSVFGQENFVSADKTVKDFPAAVDCPDIQEVLDILHYVAVDATARKELDEEIYYHKYVESMFGDKDREIAETKVKLEKSNKAREELGEKHEKLGEKYEELGEKHEKLGKKLEESDKKHADFQRKMAKKLKNAGIPPKEISDETGVPVDEIENL
jgi:predicted nuclease with TOPRIM domain